MKINSKKSHELEFVIRDVNFFANMRSCLSMSDNLKIAMTRENLLDIPDYSLPDGYFFHWHCEGDSAHWKDIQSKADKYNHISENLFSEQFGTDPVTRKERILFLLHGDSFIGTASSWFDNDYHGAVWGRVHWVAILPEYQGRGLARPLMSAVCRRLALQGHDKAYLNTSTARIPAINLYLSFGFLPAIYSEMDMMAWRNIQKCLKFSLNLP
jgi:GNAT superfamily N-acetyltransferase